AKQDARAESISVKSDRLLAHQRRIPRDVCDSAAIVGACDYDTGGFVVEFWNAKATVRSEWVGSTLSV
ncbi:hypothetical protein, partial [Thiohalomonas denitrificans]|uniref:hypothetical protein n=1 Tax=Thiohalomonas denitrificans TaxID=415747 RepID=UPI0026E99667